MPTPVYTARRAAHSRFVPVRNLRYHVNLWGELSLATPDRPLLVLMHGWMDVGASFQFVVDAMHDGRAVAAADWRGFGRSAVPPTDSYWFADYLGDLDALLDALSPGVRVDLAGHSMGGNVVMSYAGVRPERVRRLVNMEGFGLPETRADQAPERLRQWLDELKTPQQLKSYAGVDEVAARLMKNNPSLQPERAAWLATHWAERRDDDGRWHILGDPAHKRVNPMLYRKDEVLESWKRISAATLWVEGDETEPARWWGHRYPRADFEARIGLVQNLQRKRLASCGHMLHLDQPLALAQTLEAFLDSP